MSCTCYYFVQVITCITPLPVTLPVTYLESSSTAWITAVGNVYTTESRIINVWYGVPLSLIPNLSLKYPYLV